MAVPSHRDRNVCLVVLALLAALAVGLFVWRAVEARLAEQRLAAQRQQFAAQSQQDLQARTNEVLRLLAAPIAWAVRAPLATGDPEPINALFNELARDPDLREVMLIDNRGQVLVATNAARLGAPLGADVPVASAEQNSPTVLPHAAGTAFLFVPITDPKGRLGTVIVYYQAAPAGTRKPPPAYGSAGD